MLIGLKKFVKIHLSLRRKEAASPLWYDSLRLHVNGLLRVAPSSSEEQKPSDLQDDPFAVEKVLFFG